MHVHIAAKDSEIYSINAERTMTLSAIQKDMARSGISRSTAITIAWKGNMRDTRMRNDSVIALCRKNPALIPVCSVHPFDGDSALTELDRVHKMG